MRADAHIADRARAASISVLIERGGNKRGSEALTNHRQQVPDKLAVGQSCPLQHGTFPNVWHVAGTRKRPVSLAYIMTSIAARRWARAMQINSRRNMMQLRKQADQIHTNVLESLITGSWPRTSKRDFETDRSMPCSEFGKLAFHGKYFGPDDFVVGRVRIVHFRQDVA